MEHQPHRNYVMQWNLNVQRELAPNLTAVVGYVGSRGVHQPFRADDVNVVLPTLTSAGYLWPCGPDGTPGDGCTTGFLPSGTQANPVQSSTINPNGAVRGVTWAGGSNYHALQVGVTEAMNHGLRVQGSFTFAKSIDTSSATLVGDAFGNSVSSLNWFDLKLGRGLSDFDIRRVLVINTTWQVPTIKSASGPLGFVANGGNWASSIKPTMAFLLPQPSARTEIHWVWAAPTRMIIPNRLGGSGLCDAHQPGKSQQLHQDSVLRDPHGAVRGFLQCKLLSKWGNAGLECFNLRGNAGRNILIGPGVSNFDFSLIKNYLRLGGFRKPSTHNSVQRFSTY